MMKKSPRDIEQILKRFSKEGSEQVIHTVLEVLHLMEQRLKDGVGDDNRQLHSSEIQSLLSQMKDTQDPALQQIVQRGWDNIQYAVSTSMHKEERDDILYRLIVRRFEHLLAKEDHTPIRGEQLSRNMIGPLRHALEQMCGPEFLEERQEYGRVLVQKKRDELGKDFSWGKVYEDHNAICLADDVLVWLVPYFLDLPRRRNWLVSYLCNGIAHSPEYLRDHEDWDFGDQEFHKLTGALYKSLFVRVADPDQESDLIERYGEGGIGLLRGLALVLEEDRRRCMI